MNAYIIFTIWCVDLALMFQQTEYRIEHHHLQLVYYNKTLVDHAFIHNVKPNRTYRAYSVFFELKQDFDGDGLKLNIGLDAILNNVPKLRIFQFDIKTCSLIGNRLFGTDTLMHLSNLTECPLKKGFYGIHNFNINDNKLPPHIPPGKYRLVLSFLSKSSIIATLHAFLDVIYDVKQ